MTAVSIPARGRTATAPRERRHPSLLDRVRAGRLRLTGESTSAFWLLAAVVVVLNLVGLVMVLSASSVMSLETTGSSWTYFLRQLVWMAVGAVVLWVVMSGDLRSWRRYSRLGLLVAGGLLVMVLVPGLGVSANGSTRWVGLGPLVVQPAELAKLALLLFVADLLDRRAANVSNPHASIAPVMLVTAVFAGLLMLQPNLGTTIILVSIVLIMLFVAGAPPKPLLACGGAGAAVAVLLALWAPYRRARILAFMHPWHDPGNTGYQVIQSQVGLADGHLLGLGLGASRAKWGFLPFAHTDFIFSIIGEELGLVGAVAVLALFVGLAVFGVRTAMRSADRYGALVAVGATAWLAIQAFVNIGACIGILPITGVPLPFISFGGSSLVVTLAATGLLLNVARHPGGGKETFPSPPPPIGAGPAGRRAAPAWQSHTGATKRTRVAAQASSASGRRRGPAHAGR